LGTVKGGKNEPHARQSNPATEREKSRLGLVTKGGKTPLELQVLREWGCEDQKGRG